MDSSEEDEDEEGEIDYFQDVSAASEDGDSEERKELLYGDFFDPPDEEQLKTKASDKKVCFKDSATDSEGDGSGGGGESNLEWEDGAESDWSEESEEGGSAGSFEGSEQDAASEDLEEGEEGSTTLAEGRVGRDSGETAEEGLSRHQKKALVVRFLTS